MSNRFVKLFAVVVSLLGIARASVAQEENSIQHDTTLSLMRSVVEQFATDLSSHQRFDRTAMSQPRLDRLRKFFLASTGSLENIDFDLLNQDGKVDYLLLKNYIDRELRQVEHDATRESEVAPLIPFAGVIVQLEADRQKLVAFDPRVMADKLTALNESILQVRKKAESKEFDLPPHVANRAADKLQSLSRTLSRWHQFYHEYDPLYTWWNAKPYEALDRTLRGYVKFVREKMAGINDSDQIIGDPIGSEALSDALKNELIPYTPEELIAIAEKEFEWCEREFKRAANDMGVGDDWRKAMELVKQRHVQPGDQPAMIKTLALEAIEYLQRHELVTIPDLCRDTWRMQMMTPAAQKVSPYFLGGETIIVSYPTSSMDHKDKLMSMRGNNEHFARATVHHELIPGHHLQGFMSRRFKTHRRTFRTPFLVEGWALYWEMLLWDRDFQRSPEDRIGMLFWRAHRCARIIFSLKFHLGEMTALDAIEFLIERVGHERNNATAEVRRSVAGNYGPLYQAAYMLGGLQLRGLNRELVGAGHMSNREFHDAVLLENSIPVELIRAKLTNQPLTRDFESSWRFYDQD